MKEVDDAHISVRFRYGVHTIFLFIDSLAPFSCVTEELLSLLRERYPDGLTKSVEEPEKTTIPDTAGVVYGVLAVPNDTDQGWKKLKVGQREEFTPTKCGLKDDSVVAFTIVDSAEEDGNGDAVEFEVAWPEEDDGMYEEDLEGEENEEEDDDDDDDEEM